MKKWSVLLFITFLATTNSFAKNQKLPNFKIDGTINADSGKVSLFFFDYLPDKTKNLEAQVKNNKFSFSGYIPESQGVYITFNGKWIYMSKEFIIDKGEQIVSINMDSLGTIPNVKNKTMQEEYPKWTAFNKDMDAKYKLFNQRYDSLQKVYNRHLPEAVSLICDKEIKALYKESDSTLLQYTKKNPNSKIAFWRLIHLMDFGYEPIFDSIYNTFSNTLKDGYAGKTLYQKLKDSKQLSAGQQFPDVNCIDMNHEKFSPTIFLKNKLTLVDFWYSNCSPCRRQFPNMRELYKQYGDKGFEIVGISVDKTEYKKEWENLIINDKLIWKQYLDRDGVEVNKLSIYAFPTNFLIDNTGKIIFKNISMAELKEFLNKTFK
ncbi:MAG: TlpA disulfide reductase family protein [Dysgonamonadaceae bacterium]